MNKKEYIKLGQQIGNIIKKCNTCRPKINFILYKNADLCPECFEKIQRITQK